MDSLSFYKHIFAQIPDISQTNLIISGYLNFNLDTYLDRSSSHRAPASKSSIFMREYLDNSNLFYIWMIFYSQERVCSFCVHNMYRRIDYFLGDAKLLPHISNVFKYK